MIEQLSLFDLEPETPELSIVPPVEKPLSAHELNAKIDVFNHDDVTAKMKPLKAKETRGQFYQQTNLFKHPEPIRKLDGSIYWILPQEGEKVSAQIKGLGIHFNQIGNNNITAKEYNQKRREYHSDQYHGLPEIQVSYEIGQLLVTNTCQALHAYHDKDLKRLARRMADTFEITDEQAENYLKLVLRHTYDFNYIDCWIITARVQLDLPENWTIPENQTN